jgi:hypothetical protein
MIAASMRGAPECQVLFELFASPRGKVWLGRIDLGIHAGRIVLLRETNDATRPQLAQAVDAAKHFVHPKLLKVLGVVSDQSRSFVASEYIPGVSLFELIAMARKRQRAMVAGAAVRVIIDALKLVPQARAVLNAAGRPAARLLHADCIWVTDYGETLLSEAGVSAQLIASASSAQDLGVDSESQDMLTASVELFHLASGRLMTGDMCKSAKTHLSAPLAKVLEGVFSWDPTNGFAHAEALAAGLAAMPPVLVGTEATVAEELRHLMADVLDERRRKLALLRGSSGLSDPEGATRVYGPVPGSEDDDSEEATLAFDRAPLAPSMRELKRVVAVEKPLEPESPAPVHRSSTPAKPAGVFPEQPFGELPAVRKRQPRRREPASTGQRLKLARARLLRRFYAQRATLERVLLGVLVLLIVVASVLVLTQPSRLHALVERVKSLR